MAQTTQEYKFIGDHAQDLASGVMLGPGDTAELDEDAVNDPHNTALIEAGLLISTAEVTEETAPERKSARGSGGGEK